MDTPGDALDVCVSGDYAYVADYHAGLQVIDIHDPENPTCAGYIVTPGKAMGVHVSGDYVFIANGEAGLIIMRPVSPVRVAEVVDSETIRAILPGGLEAGVYHVLVENPDGARAIMRNGFAVEKK